MITVLVILFFCALAYWLYVHASFAKTLKNEDPELYKKHSAFSPLRYTCGFAWIQLVLTNKHKQSKSQLVVSMGNRLRKAYNQMGIFIAALLCLIPLRYVADFFQLW